MTSRFTATRIATETTNGRNALLRVRDAMRNAAATSSCRTWRLAMRTCLRLAYNGGAVRGGSCVRAANGLTPRGECDVTA